MDDHFRAAISVTLGAGGTAGARTARPDAGAAALAVVRRWRAVLPSAGRQGLRFLLLRLFDLFLVTVISFCHVAAYSSWAVKSCAFRWRYEAH